MIEEKLKVLELKQRGESDRLQEAIERMERNHGSDALSARKARTGSGKNPKGT